MSSVSSSSPASPLRLRLMWVGIYVILSLITGRLFYWQVIQGANLQAQAQSQYQRTQTLSGSRGSIFTADGALLVGNQTVYRLFAQPHLLTQPQSEIADKLTALLAPTLAAKTGASEAAQVTAFTDQFKAQLITKLAKPDAKWVSLVPNLTKEQKAQLEQLELKGLGFEPSEVRLYPEASLAAHITGFVGRNESDEQVGYFGIEGALEHELKARQTRRTVEKDALGFHLWGGPRGSDHPTGRNVTLTIRRDMQQAAMVALKSGMERYGAKAGEILIMEPSTGKILASAAYPTYDPENFNEFPAELYKNPSATALYEPGSTFKTLTVSAGIDAGVITPETTCPKCDGPRQVASYAIKTWNNVYNPNVSMNEALAKSDNTAMVYITDLLGKDKFVEYLQKFGIGEKTYVEWQEDTSAPFPARWGPVELATISFGQGISTTSLQLLKAVGAIANDGVLMRPMIVEAVTDPETGEKLTTEPIAERTVISAETARTVTGMMEVAAASGEAKWTASKNHRIAGKTGTSQVAVDGSYDETKTITSFIGFAPPENPKFIMLVKLVEPSSSPWAAETAAPLWYQVANRLFLLLEIPPDK